VKRVLLASRGEFVIRLVEAYRRRGWETCSVFSAPESEAPWVEAADYAVYLNGATVEETYLHAERVISAAHDAGATVIHPGLFFFAERPDFLARANAANLHVVALERSSLERINDPLALSHVAQQLGVPVIPSSDILPQSSDGLDWAMSQSLPLYVKAAGGGVVRRVDRYEDLSAATAWVRHRASVLTGSPAIYLSARVPDVRQIGTTVVRAAGDRAIALGHHDKSAQVKFRSWVEELGPGLVPTALDERMTRDAQRLVEALDLVGVVRVRWAVNPEGGHWLLGVSGRLTSGYALTEAVHDIDLVDVQLRLADGEPLGWEEADPVLRRSGIQVRLLHVDPLDGSSRPSGVLERLDLPDTATVSVGVAEGQSCSRHTEPLLATLTFVGDTRSEALDKAREGLARVRVEGVVCNLEPTRRLLDSPAFARGPYDVFVLDPHLGVSA
jgi:acetyl/propionyl-CoA carboxylase alpha subunit